MRVLTRALLPRLLRAGISYTSVSYEQGQSPEPRIREYFYYIDHQGQLFMDDAKVKNFITCFKDKQFLVFFFKHLKRNQSGRYEKEFPYISPCGRERNFIRCDDQPIVFTHLLPEGGPSNELLSFCGGGDRLVVKFEPEKLLMLPENGRVYHPAPEKVGSVGLVKSTLAFELSSSFEYSTGPSGAPTHFKWNDTRHRLTNELVQFIKFEKGD